MNSFNKSGFFLKLFYLFIVLSNVLINFFLDFKFTELNYIILMISSSFLIFKSRKENGILIVFLFVFFSFLQLGPEFLFNVRTTLYSFFYIEYYYGIVLSILTFYISFLALFLKEKQKSLSLIHLNGNNSLLFTLLVITLISIIIFGVNRGIYSQYTISINTIYEYFVMIFLFAFYYSNKSKLSTFLLITLGLVFIIQDFYYGGRISSLQLTILLSILFLNKLSYRQILLFLFGGYILFNIVEIYRINYEFDFSILVDVFDNLFGNPLTDYRLNTFSEVFYSSSGLVFTRLNIFSLLEIIESFYLFSISIFLGGENTSGNIVLFISQNISSLGGGSYLPAYFYFWFGWLGVFFISLFTAYLLNLNSSSRNTSYKTLLYILVLSMIPRWFLYSPLILFRYSIVNFSIVYFLLFLGNILTQKKTSHSKG
jgi:hypothetical protein